MCGQLVNSLYGTRDAAQNWEAEYTDTLAENGFICGKAASCAFHYPQRDIKAAVHGDDIVAMGQRDQLDWLRSQVAKRCEIKADRIGPKPTDGTCAKILNRLVRWTSEGIAIEGDQRHAELTSKTCGISGKSGSTPIEAEYVGESPLTYRPTALRSTAHA